jgi:sporulation protein YlmC with PRC-barrel domain
MISKRVVVAAVAATLAGVAYAQHSQTTGTAPQAQSQTLATLPPGASTVTNWYKQDVYDPSENKIGEISDVLVDKDGKISAFIVSVGGFLGMGEKHVAVPFDNVRETHGEVRGGRERWLTMNTTRDALKSAAGFKYDRGKATWVPA